MGFSFINSYEKECSPKDKQEKGGSVYEYVYPQHTIFSFNYLCNS